MKSKVKLILLFCAVTVTAQNNPNWFNTGKIPGYDSKHYLLGFGIGSTFSESISKAQEQIASQVSSEISSELNMIESEISVNNRTISSSAIQQSIKTKVNQSISGATVIKQESSGGKYYTAAGLSKSLFISSMQFKLMELEETANILYGQAEKGLNRGHLEYYFANRDRHAQTLLELSSTAGILRSFGNPTVFSVDKNFNKLIAKIKEIRLSVESGKKQTVVLGFPFKDPVSVKATMKYSGKEIPLVNIPIRTKGISPKEMLIWTNGEGVANFTLPASFSDESAKSIQFEMLKKRLPNNGSGLPGASSVKLRFSVVDNLPITFGLQIYMPELASRKMFLDVQKKITKTITSLGHVIDYNNDKLLLRNTITVENPKEIEGKDGTMYLVTGELFVELVSVKENKVLATTSSASKGLDKRSEKKALEKAVKSIKLTKRSFGKILEEAEEELIAIMTSESKSYFEEGKSHYNLKKFGPAMASLSKVYYGENIIVESNSLMEKIRLTIQREEDERIARELAEKERERHAKLEAERIRAEAKIQAEKAKADRAWAEMKKAEFDKISNEIKADILKLVQDNNNPAINDVRLDAPLNKLDPYDQIIIFIKSSSNNTTSAAPISDENNKIIGSWQLNTALNSDGTTFLIGKEGEYINFNFDGTFIGFGLNTAWSPKTDDLNKVMVGGKNIKIHLESLRLYLSFRISGKVHTLVYSRI
jgi:hypothetical protein